MRQRHATFSDYIASALAFLLIAGMIVAVVFFRLAVSYLLAAACSSVVFVNPALTEWSNGWAWFWIAFWFMLTG